MQAIQWRLCLAVVGILTSVSALRAQEQTPPAPQPQPGAAAQQPPTGDEVAPRPAPNPDAPRVQLSAREWDFGAVWSGQPAESEIMIGNVGKSPLQIISVKTSCGCTAAKPTKETLGPGESDKITLKYNTSKKTKKVSQYVTIVTNDPEEPEIKLHVHGEVNELFESEPADSAALAFGRVTRDTNESRTVTLKNKFGEKVSLKLKDAATPGIKLSLEEVSPGMEYKLTAVTIPPLPDGSINTEAVLETGLPFYPEYKVRVQALVMPRISVQPTKVFVPATLTQATQRTIRVNYQADKPLTIKEVKSNNPKITATLMPADAKTAQQPSGIAVHQIKVSLPPGNEIPEEGAQIEIYTDDADPQYQKLVVDVTNKRDVAARPAPPTITPSGTPGQLQPGVIQQPVPPGGAQPKPGTGEKPGGTP